MRILSFQNQGVTLCCTTLLKQLPMIQKENENKFYFQKKNREEAIRLHEEIHTFENKNRYVYLSPGELMIPSDCIIYSQQ